MDSQCGPGARLGPREYQVTRKSCRDTVETKRDFFFMAVSAEGHLIQLGKRG